MRHEAKYEMQILQQETMPRRVTREGMKDKTKIGKQMLQNIPGISWEQVPGLLRSMH